MVDGDFAVVGVAVVDGDFAVVGVGIDGDATGALVGFDDLVVVGAEDVATSSTDTSGRVVDEGVDTDVVVALSVGTVVVVC